MAHLHPERWRELEHDFVAAQHIDEAVAALGGGDSPHPVVRGLLTLKGKLHECVRVPGAVEEFNARVDGTFVDAPTPVVAAGLRRNADAVIASQGRMIEQLQKQLDALTKAGGAPATPTPEGVIAPRGPNSPRDPQGG